MDRVAVPHSQGACLHRLDRQPASTPTQKHISPALSARLTPHVYALTSARRCWDNASDNRTLRIVAGSAHSQLWASHMAERRVGQAPPNFLFQRGVRQGALVSVEGLLVEGTSYGCRVVRGHELRQGKEVPNVVPPPLVSTEWNSHALRGGVRGLNKCSARP